MSNLSLHLFLGCVNRNDVDDGTRKCESQKVVLEESRKKRSAKCQQQQLRAPFGEVAREHVENEFRLQQSRWQLAIYECTQRISTANEP